MRSATSATRPERAAADRWIYAFEEGSRDLRHLLGGKGANLAEMTRLGLPVPPGFTVTTDACRAYLADGERMPDGLEAAVDAALAALEADIDKRLGDPADPLLLSVRSGAAFSMPGMMDTILDLGLNDETVIGLADVTGDARFAWDAYRRFVGLFGKVVLGVPGEEFDELLVAAVEAAGVADESGLGADDFRALTDRMKARIVEHGKELPADPHAQLRAAIEAVFRSWNGRRARDYRKMERIPDDLGTAVNVQAMVFGNLGPDSGSGVAFTRNPATGEAVPYGDWLTGAQGEDVVAGIRITESLGSFADKFADCHAQLMDAMATLERHYRDMCDIEFTVERGRLFMLQTRAGKRTAQAALHIAVDMANEGLISKREAVARVTPQQLDRLLHPHFDQDARYDVLTHGLAASPGAAVGEVCFTADEAVAVAESGVPVVLIRPETSPEDLHGMIAAEGILTTRGGLVSHAAVVARGMGKPAVCGAEAVDVDVAAGQCTVGDTIIRRGDVVAIDGSTGALVLGEVPLVVPEPSGAFGTLLGWADGFRRLGVRANADTAEDAERARTFGAEGIGLCRTEHMFLGERLPIVRAMLLADDPETEAAAMAELEATQRADFEGVIEAMDGLPVTVRLLDPPLHEFLPDVADLRVANAEGLLDAEGKELLEAAQTWQEANPMLGVRGCRLGIIKPGLYRLQTRALMQAAVAVAERGGNPQVEIMVPLISTEEELTLLSGWIEAEAEEVIEKSGRDIPYRIGTMIETPRAALTAGAIARHADFFSFGTNDLTQLAYGFSRDDVEARLMPVYLEHELLEANPFATLDPDGVGRLVRLASTEGRTINPRLHVGICGEHGGDPESVRFCHDAELDYVSCSPFRVPVARLAAAHAALGIGDADDK